MTVVAAYLYRDGHRIRPLSIDEKVDCRDQKSEFVWIGIADPTKEEMHSLANNYGLHPLAVEDAIKADQLVAWAAIMAVPTVIAGIYGLNFDNMPELHARYGYVITIAVIAMICVLLFRRCRRLGWL